MKLYFSPGACSMSPHIVLREIGAPFEAERIDGRTHLTASGKNYYDINPKGSVPCLVLDDGQVLTEGAVIVQYLADHAPGASLAPKAGTMERYRLQEWLNFIATDLHKGLSPLYNPKLPDEIVRQVKERFGQRLDFVEKQLAKGPFLMGEQFTVADAYLFTIVSWGKRFNIDLGKWPALTAFMEKMRARPAVQATLKAEGLPA